MSRLSSLWREQPDPPMSPAFLGALIDTLDKMNAETLDDLGVARDNVAAREMILTEKRNGFLMGLTPDSPAVVLALSLHPNP